VVTAEELDEVYTQVCHAMTRVGEDKTELYLGRLVLLLVHEIDDPERIGRAIAHAGEGM
jgi:hypothetical protein